HRSEPSARKAPVAATNRRAVRRAGLAAAVQAEPSQCSVRVFGVEPIWAKEAPTAHASREENATTPVNWPPCAREGVEISFHRDPVHSSTRGSASPSGLP